MTVSLYMIENEMGEVRFYAYTAGPLAAIIAPFITGFIADRFFNTERVLGVLFMVAGLLLCLLPCLGAMSANDVVGEDGMVLSSVIELFGSEFVKGEVFNMILLLHMICFMPTLALTASYSFRMLKGGSERFPIARLWGTLGWIAAGFVLAICFTESSVDESGLVKTIEAGTKSVQFYLGGAAGIILGLYCFFLPASPAPMKGKPVSLRDLFFVDAWAQLKNRSYAVYIVCSFLLCIPLAAYYASLQQQMFAMGMTDISIWKNTGTWIEAGMMFAMPFFLRKLGVKKMIMIGIAAWIVRYVMFSLGATTEYYGIILVVGGIALHGFCYDFFFVTGQIYVDRSTPENIRGQAQGMNVFFTQGLGMFVGAIVTQKLAGRAFGDQMSHLPESLSSWPGLWWPLAAFSVGVLFVFWMFFKDEVKTKGE